MGGMGPALLRAGAIVPLASGIFMVFAMTTGPSYRDFLTAANLAFYAL